MSSSRISLLRRRAKHNFTRFGGSRNRHFPVSQVLLVGLLLVNRQVIRRRSLPVHALSDLLVRICSGTTFGI